MYTGFTANDLTQHTQSQRNMSWTELQIQSRPDPNHVSGQFPESETQEGKRWRLPATPALLSGPSTLRQLSSGAREKLLESSIPASYSSGPCQNKAHVGLWTREDKTSSNSCLPLSGRGPIKYLSEKAILYVHVCDLTLHRVRAQHPPPVPTTIHNPITPTIILAEFPCSGLGGQVKSRKKRSKPWSKIML